MEAIKCKVAPRNVSIYGIITTGRSGGGGGSNEQPASKTHLGKVIIGDNLLVDDTGLISVDVDSLVQYFTDVGTDKFFEYIQTSSAKEWNIIHNLHKYPSVTVVDSAGSQVIGEVIYLSEDSLTINFSSAFSGKAFLN